MARFLFLIIGYKKPSSIKRILGSLDYIRSCGHVADVIEIPSGTLGRLGLALKLREYDLVVLQKKLFNEFQLGIFLKANPNIVFDLDDAVMFHELERGEAVTGKLYHRFAVTAKNCAGVIAGNRYLAEFAQAARLGRDGVIILPTPVDTNETTQKTYRTGSGVVIGWIGTKGNLAQLKSISGPLGRVLRENSGVTLKIICDKQPDMPGVLFTFKHWKKEDELADLQSIDIGIMPLVDDLWTRGKGGFKMLQYMAAGVAAVASPVGINRDIVKSGLNGFLASDDDEWFAAMDGLCKDAVLRESIGTAGRRTVEREYSLKQYNERLVGFLEGFVR